jgi:cholesterol oxidase
VTAYRLAEAGRRVCLLERGKPYPPGSFPRSPEAMARNFWDPSEGLYGMFNVWSFRGIDALVSSGLGGSSLIYANATIRKDEHGFVHDDGEYWPVSRADLDAWTSWTGGIPLPSNQVGRQPSTATFPWH